MTRTPQISPIEGGGSLMLAWRAAQRHVVVIGGGAVAAGRVRLALDADAKVTLVAPTLGAELRRRHEQAQFQWVDRSFVPADVDDADMVMTAIDDEAMSADIAQLCRARRIPVNVADVPDLCDFWFTSVYRDGPLQISVSSNGCGPAISSRLTRDIAAGLPDGIGEAIERFGRLRQAVRHVDPAPEASAQRMGWLGAVGREFSYADLRGIDDRAIESLVQMYQRRQAPDPDRATHREVAAPARPLRSSAVEHPGAAPARGVVTLVGAGPGDPTLLTIAGRDALMHADLVVADRLIAPAILDLVQGELRIARKLPGRSASAQAELEGWVIEGALRGQSVVRLKQGDPFIFGRASEELESFEGAGLAVSIIPGISSALAGPLVAGIPLTERGIADRFRVMTGQGANGKSIEVPAFDPDESLVLLMAVGRAPMWVEGLLAAGHPVDEPVAIIASATQPQQRIVRTTVARLAATIEHDEIKPPAIIVIGAVCRERASAALPQAKAG